VTVIDGPVLTEKPTVDVVVKDMRLQLQCAADANPPPTYTWIKVAFNVLCSFTRYFARPGAMKAQHYKDLML